MRDTAPDIVFDLLVVGGGVNGCGIARDAAGRGLSVLLCEQGDLAEATSSASTKLFHGGLRYLEHHEFRLVRKALIEREILWRAMPHISWPMRFVLPHHRGLRPAWLLRLGLFLYDHLGGRRHLPGTDVLDLSTHPVGLPLRETFTKGFEYADCWVDDARLVVLNARSAADMGASIRTRTRLQSARRDRGLWQATLRDTETGEMRTAGARALVNAAGPWADQVAGNALGQQNPPKLRLVRGSHIVTRRLYDHDRCYVLQTDDGRVVFTIPYEGDFTLIGTTDREQREDVAAARCSDEEADYLCGIVSGYFRESVRRQDIVWRFAGVRPLLDDGSASASAASRDYTLEVEDAGGVAPLLTVLGGKITTYRRLAEAALAKLAPYFPNAGDAWTAGASLPGGDFAPEDEPRLLANLRARYPFLDKRWAWRLWRAYGTEAAAMLDDAREAGDLGRHFGWCLTEREVSWLAAREWARSADDILWRRSKLGLRFTNAEAASLANWLTARQADRQP